jgi:hypothetical protein
VLQRASAIARSTAVITCQSISYIHSCDLLSINQLNTQS